MSDRDKELAKGLDQLHDQLKSVFSIVDRMYDLVPQFDFSDHRRSADDSDETMIEAQTTHPQLETMEYPDHERGLYQIPMFESPINIVFQNVTINGEVVDMSKEEKENDRSN